MTEAELTRALDMAKGGVFQSGENSSFFSSVMCSLDFEFTNKVETTGTDGKTIYWNPQWFETLKPDTRKTVLLHEILHVALLHHIRQGSRQDDIWNQACDIKINNILKQSRMSFEGIEDTIIRDDSYGDHMTEEMIYDKLLQENNDGSSGGTPPPPPGFGGAGEGSSGDGDDEGDESDGDGKGDPKEDDSKGEPSPTNPKGDLLPMQNPDTDPKEITAKVVQGMNAAQMSGQSAGKLMGDIDLMIDTFLKPQVDWSSILLNFFHDTIPDEDTNWNKRNRRYHDIYLPSSSADTEKLSHLIYYIDVSGSVTDDQVQKFASEVFYVHSVFHPDKITIVPFDTRLREPIEISEHDEFPELKFNGRGGTCLRPVREHMIEHEPTAAIVFSDLYVTPMKAVDEVPVVWIVIDNPKATVEKGTVVYIE